MPNLAALASEYLASALTPFTPSNILLNWSLKDVIFALAKAFASFSFSIFIGELGTDFGFNNLNAALKL